MKKNEQGFSLVVGIFAVAIIGLLGFVGWYIGHSQSGAKETISFKHESSFDSKTKQEIYPKWPNLSYTTTKKS